MNNTTTTTHLLLNAYTVETAEPTWRSHRLYGEFVLTARDGRQYRTVRPEGGSEVEFIDAKGRKWPLMGNDRLAVSFVEKYVAAPSDEVFDVEIDGHALACSFIR